MSEPDICIFVSQLVVFGGYIMSITYWTVNIRSLMLNSYPTLSRKSDILECWKQ